MTTLQEKLKWLVGQVVYKNPLPEELQKDKIINPNRCVKSGDIIIGELQQNYESEALTEIGNSHPLKKVYGIILAESDNYHGVRLSVSSYNSQNVVWQLTIGGENAGIKVIDYPLNEWHLGLGRSQLKGWQTQLSAYVWRYATESETIILKADYINTKEIKIDANGDRVL